MLQSKAGYIDARPHIRQLEEVLLQRTAGPYIWVIRARSIRHPRSPHVRFAPKADKRVDVSGHDRGADVSSPVISNYEVMILLC